AGAINLASTLNSVTSARDVTMNATGNAITLTGAVGNTLALGNIILNATTTTLSNTLNATSLTTDAAGTTAINGGSVTTSGAQTYNDALVLGNITTFTSTAGAINL